MSGCFCLRGVSGIVNSNAIRNKGGGVDTLLLSLIFIVQYYAY